jgi:hypothetical protein
MATHSRLLVVRQDTLWFSHLSREQAMTPKDKQHDPLDQSHPDLQKRNEKFKQERADSLDHTKQSGKGEDDNALANPASDGLPKP